MYTSFKNIERPHTLIEEDQQSRRGSPLARVERMFELIREKLPGPPEFILCVLAERKNSDIYGMDLSSFLDPSLSSQHPLSFVGVSSFKLFNQFVFPLILKDRGRRQVSVILALLHSAYPRLRLMTSILQMCFLRSILRYLLENEDKSIFVFVSQGWY